MSQNINDVTKYNFITKLKNLPFVEKVILFGSRARGTNASRSDIDLAIACSNIKNNEWLKVLDIIDNADTLLLIDCINLNTIDEEFKKNILKDGVEL